MSTPVLERNEDAASSAAKVIAATHQAR